MPGIPTEAVTAYPGSVHDVLTQRLELQLLWSRCGNTHSPRCHSSPLGIVGPVTNFRECHESLCWGHAGPLIESSLAILCLGAGTEPAAPLVQHRAVAGQQPCTWGVLTNS